MCLSVFSAMATDEPCLSEVTKILTNRLIRQLKLHKKVYF